ncbi:AraC family transcriptional regulator [Periweissella cryptocerci]|uniref:AraC family transcriptional regulator n=1 Tax=Periweissella cryptocerci TaxID=2506420 RepID=A0A4V1AIL8_9LACO|nr:AraC family transcriptional regulator [Periweissella cryptocerci]QBO35955.1 AraC family transcriptional regulator [Periweissella cryptocerci]
MELFFQSIGAFDSAEASSNNTPNQNATKVANKNEFEYSAVSEIHPSIQSAIDYVAEHITESITLDEVSQHVFLSNYYFSKLFKKEMFTTFTVYVNDKKMQRAKEMLVNPEIPIQQISQHLGFAQTSYFSKVFKQHAEMTPSEFRQHSLEENSN